ncbi:hypothetical protein RGQ29_007932 [Quercus rubra]|uniref:Endonuclease/exonuclease/phosphatase domain-containing protein n=1 Tax=Quercus rubra TaxID=3512 RepID=A0AAN7DYS2_QUERU|nr:hypothetical protein RGQ29_007932 [Quercus rubra]
MKSRSTVVKILWTVSVEICASPKWVRGWFSQQRRKARIMSLPWSVVGTMKDSFIPVDTTWKGMSNPWRVCPLEVLGMSTTLNNVWKLLGWILRVVVKHLPLVDVCPLLDHILLMNIIAWNCRGARKPAFKSYVKELVRNHDLAILIVMETRIEGDMVKEITDELPFDGAIHTNIIGYAGGLWLLWDDDRVEMSQLANTKQEIHVIVKVLWSNLKMMAKVHDMLWVMAGNFNESLMEGDKFGGRGLSVNRALQFKECLDACSMIDIGLSGPGFTWTNRREVQSLIQERIDRFFVNSQWCLMYPEAQVVHLTRYHSDHIPVLMELQPRFHENRRKLFKFQTCWLSNCIFPIVVTRAYRQSTRLA